MTGPSMFPMKSFLGRHRQIIGGTFGKRWSSGKMHCFLTKVVSWNGTTNDARSFVHDQRIYTCGISSLDTRIHGANSGPIFRERIKQICENEGCMPSNVDAFAKAKDAALTPREERRSSVGSTPLNSHRSALVYSSSSVGSTPLSTPRGPHLCTAPPPQLHSLVLAWFMGSSTQASFIRSIQEACKGMPYYHQDLSHLWDIVTIFRRDFRDATLENPITQAAFFDRLSHCNLIQNALRASLSFRSLQQVAFADEMLQIMFLEGLIFSFFNACKKTFRMINCRIELKSDGENFSISLFPQHLRIAYLAESLPIA